MASGGGTGTGGASGAAGAGSLGAEPSGRDGGVASDVAVDNPRADASSSDGPAQDAARDGSRTDGLSAAAQQYVQAFAEPYCTRLAACCAQAGYPTSGLAACEANELGFVKYLDDGSEVMDSTTIQTILTQLQNSCDQPSYALLASTTQGTRLAGEACDAVDQCAGDPALCLSAGGPGTGKCMTPPRGKAGDGCSVTCDDITLCKWGTSGGKSPFSACYDQDGLRCDTSTYTCVPFTAVGAKCADFSECGAHAECTNGTCQAKAALGAPCGGSTTCDSGLQCNSTGGSTSTCQKLSVAWSGSCSP